MTSITAQRLLTANGPVECPRIDIDDAGIIVAIECDQAGTDDVTLTPAFFDIHVHGAAGRDVMEGTSEALDGIGAFLATHGVAYYLATTVTAPLDKTLRALEGIANAIESTAQSGYAALARPLGIHLEGPFISHAKRGVHAAADLLPAKVSIFQELQQAARGHIKLMTVAPELPEALELIEYAVAEGTQVSIGHSDATAIDARAAIVAGASSATHTFNAMRRLDHREPGIAGVVLDSEDLYAELICDGIHVAPEFVRMWLAAKGEDRAILITDGISATGMPDGNYRLGELEVTVADNRCLLASELARGVETLAGSVLTMDRAVARLRRYTGATLATAVRLATHNPAKMLGLDELGTVGVGRPANFNVFTSDGHLQQTILRGRAVEPPQ
jgi:N-acetylglucosamine-6-phosphate deacetylase